MKRRKENRSRTTKRNRKRYHPIRNHMFLVAGQIKLWLAPASIAVGPLHIAAQTAEQAAARVYRLWLLEHGYGEEQVERNTFGAEHLADLGISYRRICRSRRAHAQAAGRRRAARRRRRSRR